MSWDQEMPVVLSPTKDKSKSIQAIDREAVHRICSGQVVLNLATAIKELVENSLDAGATSIEIRLREYGSELVEVVDNGCGVEEANFEGLTLKHHTSKLREFTDLLGVETFGFRGEALSSLCALSELIITTRHKSSNMGTKLTYDSRGSILNRNPCARQVGTTVSLANLFSPLPVRQKEFLRNLKREFVKMSQLLHAYCLISTGVKILCSNQTKRGGKSVIVSTQGSPTFKGNITCIFGAKQASSLLDIELETPSANHLEEIGLSNFDAVKGFELEGCVSSCAHGQGRSSTDRQFYYINSRPCDPSKVSKVVNEVYHQFNLHQFPFIFLNIKTARDSIDINVTPDKRKIFLDNEKLLIATVKASLLKLYEKIPKTYQVQNAAVGPVKSTSDVWLPDPCTQFFSSSPVLASNKISSFSSLLKNFSHSANKTEGNQEQSSRDYSNMKTGRGVKRSFGPSSYDRDGRKQLCLNDFVSHKKSVNDSIKSAQCEDTVIPSELELDTWNGTLNDTKCTFSNQEHNSTLETVCSDTFSNYPITAMQEFTHSSLDEVETSNDKVDLIQRNEPPARQLHTDNSENLDPAQEVIGIQETALCHLSKLPKLDINDVHQSECTTNPVLVDEKEKLIKPKSIALNVCMDKVRILFNKCHKRPKEEDGCIADGKPRVRFYAEIDPTKNKSAELELNKEISKDMFSKMEIIGQFNLGFIITKLGHDLFIVDQHATDEKYNFETLQSQTILRNQKLVIPQALELTAVNESILMDNLDIFLKNGFNFVIDNNAEPTKRVRLSAKPISHNWEFGKEDIDELLFMLQDSPQTMCRPSRVRAMFASRACRKSVMIGTALSKSTMRQLINHMGEIEQPWNCPHGRPTMRHLVNLELVRKKEKT